MASASDQFPFRESTRTPFPHQECATSCPRLVSRRKGRRTTVLPSSVYEGKPYPVGKKFSTTANFSNG
ncbi:MAG: hypothetical protein ACXW4G_09275 [Candidatus Deferrimicrobiaceae bacterium]